MSKLRPVRGSRTDHLTKKPKTSIVRVVFLPDETGYVIRMVDPDDLLPRKLSRAVRTTIPEDALGSLDD